MIPRTNPPQQTPPHQPVKEEIARDRERRTEADTSPEVDEVGIVTVDGTLDEEYPGEDGIGDQADHIGAGEEEEELVGRELEKVLLEKNVTTDAV